MIVTAEDFYAPRAARAGIILPANRHAEYPLALRRQGESHALAAGGVVDSPVPEPASSEVAGSAIPVKVNHGRWVVECPGVGCGGAQIASREDHRFFCVECGNSFVERRWLPVAWPVDADRIAAALDPRPEAARNWVGELLDQLHADNRDHINGLV